MTLTLQVLSVTVPFGFYCVNLSCLHLPDMDNSCLFPHEHYEGPTISPSITSSGYGLNLPVQGDTGPHVVCCFFFTAEKDRMMPLHKD